MNNPIGWCDATWNPITGCTKVSPACDHCYAERMAKRLAGRFGYPNDDPFRVTFHSDRIGQPALWKKPRRIFVCSMSDLWHPDVKAEDRAAVIRATNLAPQHTYLFLTKRPEKFDEYWSAQKNFWLGVTVEDQQRADERIPALLKCKAAWRFVSCEPLLGLVNLQKYLGAVHEDLLECENTGEQSYGCFHDPWMRGIDWVIAGGETGPKSRLSHPDWFCSIRDQCQEAGVSFYFKGWGQWKYGGSRGGNKRIVLDDGVVMSRVVKKKSIPILYGRKWTELPGAK